MYCLHALFSPEILWAGAVKGLIMMIIFNYDDHTFNSDGYLSKAHKEELLRREVQSRKFLLSFLGFGFFTQVGRVPKLQAPVVRNVFCQSVLSIELNTQAAHSHKRYPRLFCLLKNFFYQGGHKLHAFCAHSTISPESKLCVHSTKVLQMRPSTCKKITYPH